MSLESRRDETVTQHEQLFPCLSDYVGLDYSFGRSNRSVETGIHYGIIRLASLSEYATEAFEPDYGEPHCPKCGNEARDFDNYPAEERDFVDSIEGVTHAKYAADDYFCLPCKYVFGAESAFSDEPLTHFLDAPDHIGELDSTNDVWLYSSPYYTYAQYCSPCAPGACNLDSPCTQASGAPKTYCFGHDWFDGGKAPYPVYRVADDSIVLPEER